MKKIIFCLTIILIAYIVLIYAKGDKKKYIFKENFQGVAIVYVNQDEGKSFENTNVVYDFKNSNLIAVKNKIPTGYYPYGFLEHISIKENGQEDKLKRTGNTFEEIKNNDSTVYLWEYYFTIGNCNGVEYETNIICTKSNLKKYLLERDKLVNSIVCIKATQ